MKNIIISLVIFCSATSIGVAEHFTVFLMGGQSNMSGSRFTTEPSDLPGSLQSPKTDVFLYSNVSRPQIPQTFSQNGDLAPYTHAPSDPDLNFFGPEVSFGRDMADGLPSHNIALIKYAADGTSLFHDWNPNPGSSPSAHGDEGYHYDQFQGTVSSGLTEIQNLNGGGNTYEIAGMLWVQGEADQNNDRLDYESNLNTFIGDVRSEYGSNLPFFFSALSANQDFSGTTGDVRADQDAVAAGDANAFLIQTDSFPVVTEGFGTVHYSSEGQRLLGEAFADQVLIVIPEPSTLVLTALGILSVCGMRVRRLHPFTS